jgi:hypothetical protein
MTFPRDLLLNLDAQLAELLSSHGYVRSDVEANGPFDSYFAEFRNKRSLVALVWDGKEGWLSLRSGKRSFFSANVSENELFFERFPGLAVPQPVYQAAAAKLLGTLAQRLASGL